MAFLALLLSLIGFAFGGEATGILKVNANVKGAEVWVDGALLGTTPLLKYVSVGSHPVRVVADHHEPYVRNATIQLDQTLEINATLQPGPGSVEFTGPAGAILVFNKSSYTLPVRVPSPGAGQFEWVARAEGFEEGSGSISTVAGRNHLVAVQLESSAGIIAVTTKPAGATVWIDGEAVGVTPLRHRDDEAPHALRVELPGHASVFTSVDTTGGRRAALDLELEAEGFALVVETGSDAAELWIDGNKAGSGAKVELPAVAARKMRLEVREAGLVKAETTLKPPDRGRVELRLSGKELVARKPLTQRWGFWAAIGGGALAAGGAAAVVAVATAPEPPPTGDTTVTLP